MAIETIFPVIIARDAAKTIELTLASLREFPEVIVYDHGSQDRTQAICEAYPNVHFVESEFLGGGRTRNRAASLAEGDWILALDPGDYLSDALLASLRRLELHELDKVYSSDRHNLFMGREMRWGGWGSSWVVRLYNRQRYQFNDALIDEKLLLGSDTRVTPMKGTLWREAVPTLDALIQDVSRRARLQQQTTRHASPPALIVLRALWAFVVSYLLKLGVLEGWRGLVVAAAASTEVFFRLMQRYVNEPPTRCDSALFKRRA